MAEVAAQSSTGVEQNIRVADYLNDQLQSAVDLENLDILLANVQKQHTLLKEQLQEAEEKLDELTKSRDTHTRKLFQQAETFKKQQVDIDRRLLILTRSDTSDDALARFNSSMQRLQRLDVAKGYFKLLLEVHSLSVEAQRNFKKSPQAALEPYLKLQDLAKALEKARPAAEDAAPHLIDHVNQAARSLWEQMKGDFASDFEKTLKKMSWPGEKLRLDEGLEHAWQTGVEKLLDLQEPELKSRDDEAEGRNSYAEPLILLPLEVMVKPLKLRFRYHFDGDRPTNKLSKPEYFLSHIISLLNTYEDFFAIHLQPVLWKRFKGSILALKSVYVDSTSAFITALLPMLRVKIFATVPKLSSNPQYLSHFIHELMSFDISLKEDWNYDGGNSIDGWKGLTWEVLVKQDWFSRWLVVERDFALARYQTIVDQPESGEIDFDSVDPGATKPTKAAIRVNDVLETITDRYRPLASFSQKLRFLIDIQIAIFDKFHSRLYSSLEAYLSISSSIARAVQGVSKEEAAQIEGVGGLEHLCRVYGSAEYLEKKMRDWSDDVFFLELWDELQDRARRHTGKNLAGSMSVEDVAERTSSAVGSTEDSGGLFDETAGAYRRLRIRAESIMQDALIHTIRESLRSYSRINPWSTLSTEPVTPSGLALTAELDSTMQQLSDSLSFLSSALAPAPLRRITQQIGLSLQNYLWDNILMRYTFSAAGGAQFSHDVLSLWENIDRYVGEGQGEMSMRKLRGALVLLSLEPGNADVAGGKSAESEVANADKVGLENTNRLVEGPLADKKHQDNITATHRNRSISEDSNDPPNLSLWDVEKRVFRNNESARAVLEQLGIDILSEAEARGVLERRLELEN